MELFVWECVRSDYWRTCGLDLSSDPLTEANHRNGMIKYNKDSMVLDEEQSKRTSEVFDFRKTVQVQLLQWLSPKCWHFLYFNPEMLENPVLLFSRKTMHSLSRPTLLLIMADFVHPLITVLKAKQNEMNRECQLFQRQIKDITKQIILSNPNEDLNHYRQQINKICNDYSSRLNRLEIKSYSECEKCLHSTTDSPSNGSNHPNHLQATNQSRTKSIKSNQSQSTNNHKFHNPIHSTNQSIDYNEYSDSDDDYLSDDDEYVAYDDDEDEYVPLFVLWRLYMNRDELTKPFDQINPGIFFLSCDCK